MDAFRRIEFHLTMRLKALRSWWRDMINPKTDEEIIAEFEAALGSLSPEDELDIERTLQEHADAAPKLDPRRTMLYHSRPEEYGCNMVTAGACRQRILLALEWAREHGITAFLADYTTPFGLLALETLVELREAGENFRVYAVKSTYIGRRRTYRTIPETEIELAFLTSRADYCYHGRPEIIASSVFPNAATQCSETGIWIVKDKLPAYLLKAWEL